MEKKGDLINQLAIISDLIEKINLDTKSCTLVIELENEKFLQTFDYISKKQNSRMVKPDKTFTIKIGQVDIIFNKSSV
jgi:hypothetical protein